MIKEISYEDRVAVLNKHYFINKFKKNKTLFFNTEHFTKEEMEMLTRGEVVTKNGCSYWVDRD